MDFNLSATRPAQPLCSLGANVFSILSLPYSTSNKKGQLMFCSSKRNLSFSSFLATFFEFVWEVLLSQPPRTAVHFRKLASN